MSGIRPPAVAGSWYSAEPDELSVDVDAHLAAAGEGPRLNDLIALIAPHAGLMYSGPVAAHAYCQLRNRAIDTLVLVGPSHFAAFDGVAVYARGGFASPLGVAQIDETLAQELLATSAVVYEDHGPHRREHSLEMQLPFVRRVAPSAQIVPLLMGRQTEETARELGDALGRVAAGRKVVLIASSDLSHYESARTAQQLDSVVIDRVSEFDPDGLQAALHRNPRHACGGGPTISVMRAARVLGARTAMVLNYADSGDVSGDKSSVVGYMAAAFGR